MIKELAKRILYPHAHSSEAFADYLRHRGVEVGEGCYFFDAQTINVDLQRPHMLRFGKYVKEPGMCTFSAMTTVARSYCSRGEVTSVRLARPLSGTTFSLGRILLC